MDDGQEIARHPLVRPGEASILDEHDGGAARRPARAVRAQTVSERMFLELGPIIEGFLRAAAGTS